MLGGIEATLRAQVRLETDQTDLTLSAQLDPPRPEIPAELTAEQRSAYLNEHYKKRKSYTGAVRPDGSLILDSVAPGEYTLTVTASEPDESAPGKSVAQGTTKVTVAAGTDPLSPIDLGEIILKPVKSPARN